MLRQGLDFALGGDPDEALECGVGEPESFQGQSEEGWLGRTDSNDSNCFH